MSHGLRVSVVRLARICNRLHCRYCSLPTLIFVFRVFQIVEKVIFPNITKNVIEFRFSPSWIPVFWPRSHLEFLHFCERKLAWKTKIFVFRKKIFVKLLQKMRSNSDFRHLEFMAFGELSLATSIFLYLQVPNK